jgi:glucose/arabinose dehydrogenase/PKD repeat protein
MAMHPPTAPRRRPFALAALPAACLALLAGGCNDGSRIVRIEAGAGLPGPAADAATPAGGAVDGPDPDAPAQPPDAAAPDRPPDQRPGAPPDAGPVGFPQDDPAFVPAPASFERLKLATRVGRVMAIDVAPNDDVYIAERDGALKIWKASGELLTAGTLEVFTGNEDGLIGVILDPGFATNRWVYLMYTDPDLPEQHLSRFEVRDDKLVMASEKVVLEIPEDREDCCHVGGGLDFDAQGNLYISVGDNSDPFQSSGYAPLDSRPGRRVFDAQRTSGNTNDLRGKILRIKPQADGTYTSPPGNLFERGGGRPEVYVMGNRNPFRIAVDRARGWLYWGEVGPDACNGCDALTTRGPRGYDEFNQAKSPGNYGWPYCIAENKPYVAYDFATDQSGTPFNCQALVNTSPLNTGARNLPPARPSWVSYSYGASRWGSGGRAAVAGAVYQWKPGGSPLKLPRAYDGSVFLMDYERGWIQRVTVDEQGALKTMESWLPALRWSGLISMRISPRGVMYVAEYREQGGAVYRIGFAGANRPPVAAAAADVDSGPVPLSVRFSSAGSTDPEMRPLSFAWDFEGDGTIDSTEANPTHVYARPGQFMARLTVSDGSSTAPAGVAIVAGNSRPVVTFAAPARGAFVSPGEKVDYSVTVRDREEAAPACDAVSVTPALGHDQHQHDGTPVRSCTGTVTTATGLIPTENAWQVIDAAFVDSGAPPAPRLGGKASVLLHFKHLEAEHFAYRGASNDLQTEPSSDPRGGDLNLAFINDGSWVCFHEMNFENITAVTYRVASAGLGGRIEVHRGSPSGPMISTANVPITGGWQTWVDVTAPITDPGTTDKTCFVFRRNPGDQGLFNLNWIEFAGAGVSYR